MSTPPTNDPLRDAIAKHGADPNEVLGEQLDEHAMRARIAELEAQLRQFMGACDELEGQVDTLLRTLTTIGPQIRDYLARELNEHATAAENAINQGAQNGRAPNPALVERAATLRLWQALIDGKTFAPNLPDWAQARLASMVEPKQPPPLDEEIPSDSGGPDAASKARAARARRRFGPPPS